MRAIRYIASIAVAVCAVSCAQGIHDNPTVENINLAKAKTYELNIDSLPEVVLQTSDSCQVGSITSSLAYKDRLVIFSHGSAYVFNLSNGRFLRRFGAESGAGCMFGQGDMVGLYNLGNHDVYEYDTDGKLLGKTRIDKSKEDLTPVLIFPAKDGKYIARNTFIGTDSESPLFSILSKDFKYEKTFTDLMIKDSFYQFDITGSPDGELYYVPDFGSRIYSVSTDGIHHLYNVNFGPKAVPDSLVAQGFMPAYEWSLSHKDYTGHVTFCYRTADRLIFSVVVDGTLSLADYTPGRGECVVRKLKVSEPYDIPPIVTYGDNCLYIYKVDINDMETNPSVVRIDFKDL